MFKKKENIILILIFLLALFLRTFKLDSLPYGFHEDELSNTYVGRFIFENGKDLYGNSWPMFYFDKFGDYPPVLPMYLSGISTYIFGINEFAARFPIALFGALTVFPLYYLALYFFKNKKVGLISSFLLAITPWHLVYSRSTAEGILALFFFISGLVVMFKWLEIKKQILFFICLLSLLLTYFLYPSFRLLVPLSLFPIPFIIDKKEKKVKVLLLIGFLSSLLLTFWISTTIWGKARFEQTSLFKNTDIAIAIKSQNEAFSSGVGQNNILEARIFYNKIIGYSREFLFQYLNYFSPIKFFIEGGQPFRYFSIPQQGLIYFTFIPLLITGFLFLSKIINTKKLYLIYLTVISVLPAALTVDFTPHFHRAILLIIPIILLCAFGFYHLSKVRIKHFNIVIVIFIFLGLEFMYFSHQYVRQSDSFKPGYKNDSNREAVLYVKDNLIDYDSVLMPSKEKLPVYYLFFSGDFNPSYIGHFGNNLTLDKIGKISFMDEWCISNKIKEDELLQGTLIVDNGDCRVPSFLHESNLIIRKDSTKAFRFLTNK